MSKNAQRYNKSQGPVLPEPQMTDIDFDPDYRLKAALKDRPRVNGITIDPQGTYIIDSGIWLKRQNSGWRIVSSVVDLPAIIPVGSNLEKLAAERLTQSFSHRSGARRIWPKDFLKKYVSLKQDSERPAITFDLSLDLALNVTRSDIKPTIFNNQFKHNDRSFETYTDFTDKQANDWRTFAHDLYRKRSNDLAFRFDKLVCQDAKRLNITPTDPSDDMAEGELLVRESMRLTNRIASEFLSANNLTVPFKAQKAHVDTIAVSDDFNFDVACNYLCNRLIRQVAEDGLPYIRLNAPMRRYHDYLALKVLGQKLAGQNENPALRDEICRLADVFNRVAGDMNYLLDPKWHDNWRGLYRVQKGNHPFQRLDAGQGHLGHALKLKADCNNVYPNVCERELQVQGTTLYLAAINLKQMGNPALQSWAVTVDRDASLNLASKRILLQTPQWGQQKNPVP